MRVTGTLTVAKVVTAPSYSKTYTVVNAATGGIVTFKAAGQTGVSIAVGESAFVYFNGTDYVKVSSTVATGVTSFTAGTTGFTPNTATTGAVTLAGTLATTNGGTGLTSFTSGGVVYASSTSALATGSGLVFDATNGLLGLGISSGFRTAAGYGIQAINGTTGSLIDLYTGGVRLGGVASTGVSTNIGSITALPLTFSTNDTERGRFDASGNLLVGATTSLSAQAGRIDLSVNGSSTAIVSLGVAGSRQGYFYTPGTGIIIASENGVLALTTTSGQAINFNTNNTKRFEFGTAGQFGIGASPDYGTAGQVLQSQGSGAAPTWASIAGGDATNNIGYLNIPQNSQSAAYTLVLADAGKHIFHPVGDNNARTFTIPANSSVAYPVGTAITFINMAAANVTIAITSDTMYLSSAGTTGSRTLAQYGSATAIKITSTNWLISGSGLT